MNCSNCYSPIPAESKRCPRCGWEIGTAQLTWGHTPIRGGLGEQPTPLGGLNPDLVPFTFRQRLALLIPILLGVSCGLGVLLPLITYFEQLLAMGLLIWIGLLALGIIGVWGIIGMWRRARDLLNGHTRREIRRIVNLRQRYNTIGKEYFALIDGLGLFNVSPHVFYGLQIGERYWLTYSLHSKRLWEAQLAIPQPPRG